MLLNAISALFDLLKKCTCSTKIQLACLVRMIYELILLLINVVFEKLQPDSRNPNKSYWNIHISFYDKAVLAITKLISEF